MRERHQLRISLMYKQPQIQRRNFRSRPFPILMSACPRAIRPKKKPYSMLSSPPVYFRNYTALIVILSPGSSPIGHQVNHGTGRNATCASRCISSDFFERVSGP